MRMAHPVFQLMRAHYPDILFREDRAHRHRRHSRPAQIKWTDVLSCTCKVHIRCEPLQLLARSMEREERGISWDQLHSARHRICAANASIDLILVKLLLLFTSVQSIVASRVA